MYPTANRQTNADFSRERGYSLTEMMVVVIIVMVVALMPIMMIRTTRDQFSRQNFVRELKAALERARFDSVKRKPEVKEQMARVVISNGSFQLVTYSNREGSVDAYGVQQTAQVRTTNINSSDAGIIAHSASGISSSSFPVTITFDSRGEIAASDVNGSKINNPAFVVCQGDCSTATAQNSNIILVSPTGTVNLLPGDASIPRFIAPAGAGAVSQGSSINKLVTLPSN